MMQAYNKSFLGIVDILGHGNAENYLDTSHQSSSAALLSRVYETLETQVSNISPSEPLIVWKKYGDGFFIFTKSDDVKLLPKLIKQCTLLLALMQNQGIPLRVAITQGNVKVDFGDSGSTVAGEGWDRLLDYEKALNWSGGWLHLPNYDGVHDPEVTALIASTYLVSEHKSTMVENVYKAPFKNPERYAGDKFWFLNWYKILRKDIGSLEHDIESWWVQYTHNASINESKAAVSKQKNTLEFAEYCVRIYQSANLMYFSKVAPNIDLGEIEKI